MQSARTDFFETLPLFHFTIMQAFLDVLQISEDFVVYCCYFGSLRQLVIEACKSFSRLLLLQHLLQLQIYFKIL